MTTTAFLNAIFRNHRSRNMARRLRSATIGILQKITGATGSLPDFLIIGAQRCGSSSLFAYLNGHPAILGSRHKEVHFFDNPDNYRRGEPWYRAHFLSLTKRRRLEQRIGVCPLVLEATPEYLYNAGAVERIHELLPSARLIALLRNPIDRAYSHYRFALARGRINGPFEVAVNKALNALSDTESTNRPGFSAMPAELLHRGLYAQQIDRVLRKHPPERLLVIQAEDLFERPVEIYDETLEFLGLPHFPLENTAIINSRPGPPMDSGVRNLLATFFKPHNAALEELLGREFNWP
jgi:hypothetical protein